MGEPSNHGMDPYLVAFGIVDAGELRGLLESMISLLASSNLSENFKIRHPFVGPRICAFSFNGDIRVRRTKNGPLTGFNVLDGSILSPIKGCDIQGVTKGLKGHFTMSLIRDLRETPFDNGTSGFSDRRAQL